MQGVVGDAEVRVFGLLKGRELDGIATMSVSVDSIVLIRSGLRSVRISFDTLDGIRDSANGLTLYSANDDVIELASINDDGRILMRKILELSYAVPELTRSLKSLGTENGDLAAAHDIWFKPFLLMRSKMSGISDPLRQCSLFDVDALCLNSDEAIGTLAALHSRGNAAIARAIEARIEYATEKVRISMARVSLAATQLQGSDTDSRLADWRAWISELRNLFRSVDEAWSEVKKILQSGVR